MLLAESGVDDGVESLRREAVADPTVAFRNANLAAVVAALGGDPDQAVAILGRAIPVASESELALALARHVVLRSVGARAAVEASAAELAWQGRQADTPEEALRRFDSLLPMLEALAPRSRDCAVLLLAKGHLRADMGDLQEALRCRARAVDYLADAEPDSLQYALALNALAGSHRLAGDVERATECYTEALRIADAVAPDSAEVAMITNNLGNVRQVVGDLDGAMEAYIAALETLERVAPDSAALASCLGNIGSVYQAWGEHAEAIAYYERALRVFAALEPDSLAVAQALHNIGAASARSGDAEPARDYYERDLAITGRRAPNTPSHATSLGNMGVLLATSGDLRGALRYYRQALAIWRRAAPGSLAEASALRALGFCNEQLGDKRTARHQYERALAIRRELAPGSPACADALYFIASLDHRDGRSAEALEGYLEALRIVEASRGPGVGDALTRESASLDSARVYWDLISLYVEHGLIAEGANLAERLRVRRYAAWTLERPAGAEALPDELAYEQARIDAERARLHDALQALEPDDEAAREEIEAGLARLRLDQRALETAARAAAPEYAALAYPEPVAVAEASERLRPGELLLLYVTTPGLSCVFALRHGAEPECAPIALSGDELTALVEDLQRRARAGEEWRDAAERLGALVLGPFAERVREAERLIVLPDGPLWSLPFALLPQVAGDGRGVRPPIRYATSCTALASGGPSEPGAEALVVGDPFFVRPAVGGEPLSRIPYTGAEAALCAELLGPSTTLLLGGSATEAAVRADLAGCGTLHLATHGVLDARHPLDSWVALSDGAGGPRDDGRLRAWEFPGIDLRECELVVLSACDTAPGAELRSEGLVGLASSVLSAGAGSVLCSLWPVRDESAAALMTRFYAHRAEGASDDEALARAMEEIRTGGTAAGEPLALPYPLEWRGEWREPKHWAPVVVLGGG